MPPEGTFGRRGIESPYGPDQGAAEHSSMLYDSTVTPLQVAAANPVALMKQRFLPIVSCCLIALVFLIFWAEIFHTSDFASVLAPSRRDLIAMGGVDGRLVFSNGEWWRLFTAPLLHASLSHVIGNSIALLFAGLLLEPIVGAGWFAALFALSGLAGSVGSILQNDPNIVGVGASGGIMGLLAAAFFCIFIDGEGKPRRRIQLVLLRIMVPALLPDLLPGAAGGHIDYAAHISGFMVGGVFAIFFNALPCKTDLMAFRDVAAALSATACALAICAFVLVAQRHDDYIAQGKGLIPDGQMPKDVPSGARRSSDLVGRFPDDPRAHFYRAIDLINQHDLSDADRQLRVALENPRISGGDLPPQFAPLVKSTLALVLQGEGQHESARKMAQGICADHSVAPAGSRLRGALESNKLCDP